MSPAPLAGGLALVTGASRGIGVPDIVVNNAGLFFIKRIEQISPAEFARAIAVNLTGAFLVTRTSPQPCCMPSLSRPAWTSRRSG